MDGGSVRDREARLEQLFPSGLTPAGRERAQQILEESSRYNPGSGSAVATFAPRTISPESRIERSPSRVSARAGT